MGEKIPLIEISVIIPVYNRRDRIAGAIESVLTQALPAIEIIVVDDGSEDNVDVLIAREYPQVIVLRQSNLGVSAARNYGIERASAPWIAFLDSDDRWLPGKLMQQAQFLNDNPDIRVCHTDEIWIRNGRRVNPMRKHAKPEGWIYPHCLPLCCVSPSSILLHSSVLADVGYFDPQLPACEDYDLWLRIFCRYQAGLVPRPLLEKHGGHADQLSHRFWGMDRFRVTALDKMLRSTALLPDLRMQTARMLIEKCEILNKGFEKRGNNGQADVYQQLADRWQSSC